MPEKAIWNGAGSGHRIYILLEYAGEGSSNRLLYCIIFRVIVEPRCPVEVAEATSLICEGFFGKNRRCNETGCAQASEPSSLLRSLTLSLIESLVDSAASEP